MWRQSAHCFDRGTNFSLNNNQNTLTKREKSHSTGKIGAKTDSDLYLFVKNWM